MLLKLQDQSCFAKVFFLFFSTFIDLDKVAHVFLDTYERLLDLFFVYQVHRLMMPYHSVLEWKWASLQVASPRPSGDDPVRLWQNNPPEAEIAL